MKFTFPNYLKDKGTNLFLVAGPCSAETEEQVHNTARELSQLNKVKIFRSGIWKPRTRPNSFEGMGEIALPWLAQAAKSNGLLSATEVANIHHVELCLKHEIDILWIGARTTVNPFSVQEIADALKGTNKIVLIKNPVNPDIDLWVGAIERVYNSGINQIAAIHRGFSTSNKKGYRNYPLWEIPIELKRRFPELPLICDPSHIGGKRDLLLPIAQKALDLDMDGLMIETHPNPDFALSDAAQQITPDVYSQLLQQLIYKKREGNSGIQPSELLRFRQVIDELDDKIIELLAERMNVSEQIGKYKKENNMTIFQLEQWSHIFKTRTEFGLRSGLSEDFLEKFLQSVHKESIRRQEGEN